MTTSQPKRQPIPFGKYLLLDRINIGGMAEVWRGKAFGAGGFERLLAIKRILPNIAEDDEFISMFIDEAKISVQLTHANIAQVHDLGQISGSYFIAMEYIPGKDMRAIFDRCRKKGEPAPIPLVAYCISKMCEGLDYAHRKKDGMGRDLNIVHRDISPQNVLVSYEGEVKVIDFGIAKAAGKATKTQAGILKGKFGYMSPEQIRGLPLDRRSDVFAIGVCLYEMLTGERLFVGDSDFSVLEKVRKAEVAPPTLYNRRIPEALEKIVLKSLAKDVDERYQYASELGDDLQRFLLTSDSIFSRKDLMQYMKSTFAEDVEREKQRLADYASIKAPEGMLAAIEMGFSGATTPPSAPALTPPPAPAPAPPARRATTAGIPRLTAAPAPPPPKEDDGAATVMMDKEQLLGGGPDPITQPGVDGEEATVLGSVQDLPTGKMPTAASRPSEPAPAPRRSGTHDGMPRLTGSMPAARSPSRIGLPPVRPVAPPEPEEDEDEQSAPPPPPPPGGPSRAVLLGGLGVVALLVLAVVSFFVSRGPSTGYVMVNLQDMPAEMRGKVSVSLNAISQGAPDTWPLLSEVPAGPVVLLVTADGYESFTQTVEVTEGQKPTLVQVTLKRLLKTASLVLSTRPEDAEVKVDGLVVRKQGSRDMFVKDVPAGASLLVEVSAPGFKPFQKQFTSKEGEPVQVQAVLESLEFPVRVESVPAGASIYVAGRNVGQVTPAVLNLPASVRKVQLRLRCHDTEDLDVSPASGGGEAYVKGSLKKLPRCR